MYVMVVFALALLSPLPFVSPFDSIVQDATAQSSMQDASSFEIIPNLVTTPLDMQNNTISSNGPRKVNIFEIGDSIYASIHPNGAYSASIVNITDINSINYVSSIGPQVTDAAYTIINGSTYALTTSNSGSFSIINMDNISNPSLVASVDYNDANYSLNGPSDIDSITIGTSTFALIASQDDRAVQIIDVTDPFNPVPASTITDNHRKATFTMSVTAVTIGSSAFVIAATLLDDGIQIINITDPYNPDSAYVITANDDGYTNLNDPSDIATVKIDSSTFALVASTSDGGVEIIDITDPYNPTPASAVNDGMDGYTALGGAVSVTTVTINSSTFALVASFIDSGVQIINITDPYNPTPASAIINGNGGYEKLSGARSIDAVTIGSSTFALVAAIGGGIEPIKLELEFISVSCINPVSSYNVIIMDHSSTILNGTAGNDIIYGTEGNDIIDGLGGNDCIYGNGGHDVINGGYGHDMIYGGDDDDTIHGGFGHDIIKGGYGRDTIDGQYGHDTISGEDGNDILYGGSGKDILNGNAGSDELFGGGSDDTINGDGGNDVMNGGSGHDVIAGGSGHDTLYGDGGKDTLNGNTGNDKLFGGGSHDIINGDAGNDFMSGGSGNDIITGDAGNDFVNGGSGNDIITGGNGKDTINGNAGDDELSGDGNDDTINGNDGNDTITGGSGDDTITGGNDNDVITGGSGNDVITGGDGDDTIDGEFGHDDIAGENGDDTLYGGGGNDTINGGNDNDVITGGSGHDIIAGGDGNNTIDGGYGNNTITDGPSNNTITDGPSNNTITDGPSNNTIPN